MTSLTRKQADLLRFIEDFTAREGISPSFQEMASGLGYVSKCRIFNMLDSLERRGFVTRTPHLARSVLITRNVKPPQQPDVALIIDRHGYVTVKLSDKVNPDWLRWHRAAVEQALSERFAAVTYPVRSAAE